MPIEQLDVVPSRYRPTTFTADMENFLAWMARNVPNYNALEQSLQLVATTGTSTTSIAIGSGSKTITTQAGKALVAGAFIYVVSSASIANLMIGQVTSYNSTTGQLIFNVTGYSGSGTISNWVIGLSGGIAAAMTFATSVTTAALYVDSTYYLTISSAKPVISFDSTDYFSYDRSNDRLDLYIGGTSRQYWSGTDGPARSNDATTNDGLVRKAQLDNATGQASTTARGTVELATSAEVAAGADSQLAVTPATMQANKIIQAAGVATTSGVAFDFTGIPSFAKRITLMYQGVSLSGAAYLIVQLGTSAGFVTSGYAGAAGFVNNGNGTSATNLSNGIGMSQNNSAVDLRHGHTTLTLLGSNAWCGSSVSGCSNATSIGLAGGSVALPGTLDRVRVTSSNGTDTFDAGSLNIMWE